MSEIYMLMTVAKRSVGRRLLACYEKIGLSSILCTLAQGTATSETLDYFGLEVTEKMVTLTVVSNETWKQVKRELEDRFQIDVPGTGIAFLMPLSSVGGRKVLHFLTDGQKISGKSRTQRGSDGGCQSRGRRRGNGDPCKGDRARAGGKVPRRIYCR